MSKPIKKILYIIIGLLVAGLIFGLYLMIVINSANSQSEGTVFFVVETGQGVNTISDNLKKAELIKNQFAFEVYLWFAHLESDLKAGEYQLIKNMSIKEISRILVGGPNSNETVIKIIEGWTAAQIADYLEENNLIVKDDFLAAVAVRDSRQIISDKTYDFLIDRSETASLEGYLFPDTYRIFKKTSSAEIIEKMLDNFNIKLDQSLRDEIKKQGKTIYEIIIMASILEKELKTDNDRKMAADLFYRRIEASIPLQSDATVNYITGKSLLQPTYSDTQAPSPYNTYLNKGLPPGPICNPSLSSIKAVIYPETNDNWYYLNKSDGTTVFSKTLEEHNANKLEYLSE